MTNITCPMCKGTGIHPVETYVPYCTECNQANTQAFQFAVKVNKSDYSRICRNGCPAPSIVLIPFPCICSGTGRVDIDLLNFA